MSDGIRIPVSVDDKDAVRGLNQLKERVSKVGSAVSGMGFALGSASTKMGGLVQQAGNIVGTLAAFGPAGAVAAAAFTVIGLAASKLSAAYEEQKKAAEAAEKALRDGMTKAQGELNKAMDEHRKLLIGEKALREEKIRDQISEAKFQFEQARAEERSVRLLKGTMSNEAIQAGLRRAMRQDEYEAARISFENYQTEIRLSEEARQAKEDAAEAEANLAKVEREMEAEARERATRRKKDATDQKKLAEDTANLILDIYGGAPKMTAPDAAVSPMAESQRRFKESQLADLAEVEQTRINLLMETFEKQKQMQREINDLALVGVDGFKRAIGEVYDFAMSEALSRADIEIRLAEAKKRGDKDRIEELEEQRLQSEETMVARIAERLSSEAIGTGSILVAEGLAKGAMGNPGGFVAAGIGAGLVAAGIAGTIGSGVAMSTAGAAAETRAFNRAQRDDVGGEATPRGSVGAGRAQTGGPTVINYYFGGGIYGSPDDVARAAIVLVDRGRRLEGRP
jgi:hypothetical protein